MSDEYTLGLRTARGRPNESTGMTNELKIVHLVGPDGTAGGFSGARLRDLTYSRLSGELPLRRDLYIRLERRELDENSVRP